MDLLGDFVDALRPDRDGDAVDRINSYITVVILLISALFISGWEYVGTPIQCWFPAYYTGLIINYVINLKL